MQIDTYSGIPLVYQGYARKSSESEDKQVQSIDRQVDDFWECHEKESFQFHDKPIEESKSAFSPGREGFAHLVKLTFEDKVNAWWTWHPNRLARNPIDAGQIIYLMDIGKLICIKTPTRIYHNTPTDKMMLQFEFTMSKKDSDDKSVFVKSGLKKRYKKGLPTGIAPLGFTNDVSQEKGNRRWLVDEHKLSLVQQVLIEFLTGRHSVTSITNYAQNTLKLTTPIRKGSGGKLVSRSYVHQQILRNPIYAGYFLAADEKGPRKRYELDPQMPRLITEDDHSKILSFLGRQNISKRKRHDSPYVHILKSSYEGSMGVDHTLNLICDCKHKFCPKNKETCPKCGARISTMKLPRYYAYVHYYNVKRRRDKEVIAKTVREKEIEAFLTNYVDSNLTFSPAFKTWIFHHLRTIKDQEIKEEKLINESQVKTNEQIEAEKKKLREMYRKKLITQDEYESDLKELNLQLTDTQQPEEEDWLKRAEEIVSLDEEFTNVIQNGTFKEKQTVLSKLRSNLLWDEEKLSIINTKPVQALVNALTTAKRKNPLFEPEKIVDTTIQNSVFDTVRPILLRGLDNVRTQILTQNKDNQAS